MRERSYFAGFHPSVLFTYYFLVIFFAMFTTNPVVLACVLAGGVCLFGMLHPLRELAGSLLYYFFVFVLIALCNPLFVHDGETILFFMNDNPVTLEAIVYGGVIALMMVGIMFWFKAYRPILTTDKFLYLFGRVTPKLSLVLSMALRFIPLFRRQAKKISQTQKTLGLYAEESRADSLFGGMRVFDSLLSWAMENSIETADAMYARGYGLPGRTSFSLFRFHKRDGILLVILGILALMIGTAFVKGEFYFVCYPVIVAPGRTAMDILRYGIVLLFLMIPALIEIKENLQWNYSRSKI